MSNKLETTVDWLERAGQGRKQPFGVHAIQAVNVSSIKRMPIVGAILLCGFLSWVAQQSGFAQQYVRIECEFKLTYKYSAPSEFKELTFPATCIVGTNEWRIEDRFFLNGRSAYYFDGTNVYQSTQTIHNFKPGEIMPWAGSQIYTNSTPIPDKLEGPLTITIISSPGGHPLGTPGANLTWLAFCSGDYLKQAGRVIPMPFNDIVGMPDSFAYTDKTEIFEDAFGLPKRVDLFTSKSQYERSVNDARLTRTRRVMYAREHPVSPYADGILKFHYEVVASTNFNGWNFPVEFNCVEYRVDQLGKWIPFSQGVGKVKSIASTTKPENVFKPEQKQMVVDARFRYESNAADSVLYAWTDTNVPPTNEAVLRAAVPGRVIEARGAQPGIRARFLKWIRVAFFVILGLPLIYLGLARIRRKHLWAASKRPLQTTTTTDKHTNI